MISLYFRTGIGEMTPIEETAPGVPEKDMKILFINVIAPGVILLMITVRPSKLLSVVYPSAANSTQTVGRLIAHIFCKVGRPVIDARHDSFFSVRVIWTATVRFHHCSTTTVYRWGYHKLILQNSICYTYQVLLVIAVCMIYRYLVPGMSLFS